MKKNILKKYLGTYMIFGLEQVNRELGDPYVECLFKSGVELTSILNVPLYQASMTIEYL